MYGRFRRLFCIVLAIVSLWAGFQVPSAAYALASQSVTRRALLIGVDDFVSYPSIYPASTNNVFAMQEALQASSIPFAGIMIPPEPVTSVQALTALIRDIFEDSTPDDVCYLYLSTHGEYDASAQQEPVLLLSDGITEDRLTPAALQEAFADIQGTKVLLLDACYSGAFIGKGMYEQPQPTYFSGEDFKVLTSSGAMEESWYWNTSQALSTTEEPLFPQGSFYFSQALSQSLNPRYGVPADANRDGVVTLRELYLALLQNHAASTPQVYPQEDDFPVFCYDPATLVDGEQARSPIADVRFTNTSLNATDGKLGLEFIALRPVRVAYQIVTRQGDQWRFDTAQLLYDTVEQYTAYGDERGAISPGRKVRTLTLDLPSDETGGYVMVQLVSIDQGKLTIHAGCVVAVSPMRGDLALQVTVPERFTLGHAAELPIFVAHAYACLLSVSIVDADGNTVRRLCHKQSTRPLGTVPDGSVFYWNGTDKNGTPVEAGVYHIRVTGHIGQESETVESHAIIID